MGKIKWSVIFENIKNVTETLAVLITGGWVLFLFVIKDEPAYDKMLKSTGDIHIDSVYVSKKGICQANLILDVKNLHPTSIIIDTVTVKLWYFRVDSLADNGFMDIKRYENMNKPFYSYSHFSNAITTYYPVDGDAHEELQFLVNDDKTHGLLCEYTLIGETTGSLFRKQKKINVTGFAWIFKCSPESSK